MICPDCNGEGRIIRAAYTHDGIRYPAINQVCEKCKGAREVCGTCGAALDDCQCLETEEQSDV